MKRDDTPARVRWARLRLQIIGTLLASPPSRGELRERINELAAREYKHPRTGEMMRVSFGAIERWYYTVRCASDPLSALARKIPKHAGTHPSISAALADAIKKQHREHSRWSFQLHYDNLVALAREEPAIAPVPGYSAVRRYM